MFWRNFVYIVVRNINIDKDFYLFTTSFSQQISNLWYSVALFTVCLCHCFVAVPVLDRAPSGVNQAVDHGTVFSNQAPCYAVHKAMHTLLHLHVLGQKLMVKPSVENYDDYWEVTWYQQPSKNALQPISRNARINTTSS